MNEKSVISAMQRSLESIHAELRKLRETCEVQQRQQLRAQDACASDQARLLARLEQLEQSLLADRKAAEAKLANEEFAQFKSNSVAFRAFQVVSLVLAAIGLIIAVCVGVWLSK